MNIAQKRTLRDITQVVSVNKKILEEQGIYYVPCEENSFKGTALLVGKQGTPYFGGYYFFDIEFPTDYPFSPIKVKSLTQDGHTRFNPNLYVQGKVCLSVLNTWHDGPQWSGVQSLESVLLAIMSDVLTDNPLENEPAYKNCGQSVDALIYNRLIWWANVNIAIHVFLTNPPSFATFFRDIMRHEFLKNSDELFKRMADSSILDNTLEISRVFSFGHTYNFASILEKLKNIKNLNAVNTN